MSLFGNPPTGGLFAPPASSAQTTPNLFASTATTETQKPPLFAFQKPQTSQAPAAPSASAPFGGLGASTAAPSGSTGLFAGLGQPPKPTGASPFGLGASSQPQQSAPASTGLFGGLGQRPTQPAGQGLGLGQSQQQNQQQPQESAQGLQNGQAANNVRAAYFEQILERGRKRNNTDNGVLGDLPSLQLGLGDIARKVRNLGTGGPSAEEARNGASVPNSQQAKAGDSRA
jgi:nuclear pore complex protein Nup93